MGVLCKVEEIVKKQSFNGELKCQWDMHSAGD